jgi:hypothetical protein
MLNPILQAPAAPAPATASAPQALRVTPPASPRTSAAEYNVLKAREKELKNQLEDVQDRRSELSQKALEASGSDKAGIQSRIGVLDERLSNIENDLSLVGRQLAAAAPASMGVETRIIHDGYNEDDLIGAGFSGAAIMFAIFLPFIIRGFLRRRRTPKSPMQQPMLGAERIDRMEHAIDSIAIEIERVSENQRFMTRLMTETQLAGTIAAVRGSAEAAKAAAEGSAHG